MPTGSCLPGSSRQIHQERLSVGEELQPPPQGPQRAPFPPFFPLGKPGAPQDQRPQGGSRALPTQPPEGTPFPRRQGSPAGPAGVTSYPHRNRPNHHGTRWAQSSRRPRRSPSSRGWSPTGHGNTASAAPGGRGRPPAPGRQAGRGRGLTNHSFPWTPHTWVRAEARPAKSEAQGQGPGRAHPRPPTEGFPMPLPVAPPLISGGLVNANSSSRQKEVTELSNLLPRISRGTAVFPAGL